MTEPLDLDRFAAEIAQCAPLFERRDLPHDQAGLTLAGISRDLLAEVVRLRAEVAGANAKLAAVLDRVGPVTIMRGRMTPDGPYHAGPALASLTLDNTDGRFASPLAAVLPALPTRDRGATQAAETASCGCQISYPRVRLTKVCRACKTAADGAAWLREAAEWDEDEPTPDAAPVVAEERADDMAKPFTPEGVGVFCDIEDAMWFARCDADGWESASVVTSDEAEQLRLRHIEQHAAPAVGPAATDRQVA